MEVAIRISCMPSERSEKISGQRTSAVKVSEKDQKFEKVEDFDQHEIAKRLLAEWE